MTTPGYTRIQYTCGHAFEVLSGTKSTRFLVRESKRERCDSCRRIGTCDNGHTTIPVLIGHRANGEPAKLCDTCWEPERALKEAAR